MAHPPSSGPGAGSGPQTPWVTPPASLPYAEPNRSVAVTVGSRELPTMPARPVLPRRHRGVFWAAVLIALAAAVAGTALALNSYQSATRPDSIVRGYLDAVARGDAPAALGYGAVPSGSTVLLTGAALQAQRSVATMSRLQVLSVQRSGNTARVDVQYALMYSAGAQPPPGIVFVWFL